MTAEVPNPGEPPVAAAEISIPAVPPSPRRGRLKAAGLHLGVLSVFTGLSLLQTQPLVQDFTKKVVGGGNDVWVNTWQIWWMRQAVLHLHNPFSAPIIHYPLGAQMYWHTLCVAKTVWGVVLLPFMRPEVAYNVLFLSCFVFTGYTTWLLLRYLLGEGGISGAVGALAALAGACVFDFSRYHFDQAFAHLNLSAMAGIPLYLYFFFKYLDRGAKWDLAGLAFAIFYTSFCEYYYIVYLATFSVLWLVAERWSRGGVFQRETLRDPRMRRAGWIALAAAMGVMPVALPLLAHAFPAPVNTFHGDSDFYLDIAGLFHPDRLSMLFKHLGASTQQMVEHLPGNTEENGFFLGWLTVALAALGLWLGIPNGKRWVSIGVFYLYISFGIYLSVEGTRDVSPAWMVALLCVPLAMTCDWRKAGLRRDLVLFLTAAAAFVAYVPIKTDGNILHIHVPMPYALFKQVVPFFSRGGMSNRLECMTTLCLAVMVAFAAGRLGALASRRWRRLGLGVPLLLCAVPNVEYANARYPMVDMRAPNPFYAKLAKEPADVAVFADGTVLSQLDQMQHGHPISFAHLSRTPVDELALTKQPLWQMLESYQDVKRKVSTSEAKQMRDYLAKHHFKYFITHLTGGDDREPLLTGPLQAVKVYHDSYIQVFKFKDVR